MIEKEVFSEEKKNRKRLSPVLKGELSDWVTHGAIRGMFTSFFSLIML